MELGGRVCLFPFKVRHMGVLLSALCLVVDVKHVLCLVFVQ